MSGKTSSNGTSSEEVNKVHLSEYCRESKGNVKIRLEKENERFRFGPSHVFTSTENYEIEVHVGDLTETINFEKMEDTLQGR